ncbi:TIGR04282 family arsenosugar biosynthesis glycosyltransferase [Streptosporangium sp. NBC_01495]|uniref:TIGR04282 family arsenosugar biosynthesis glycosyltransferase n=1 Tax=Streptosporangium sp. NBC_01495 TaxID=2903899 RepID=UPI002E2FD4D9|nr:TIGR04282 family arsenosugar biosynthesis glycosyltransferase [Streptosporangium sp. NBC_01495]
MTGDRSETRQSAHAREHGRPGAPRAAGDGRRDPLSCRVVDDIDGGGQIVVIAKEPVAGRVKTRLTPPFSPAEAAALATAALADTLDAVAGAPARHRVLALRGGTGPWLPPGFAVLPQRGTGLDERLAAAFEDAHRARPLPVVLIGMDTPQVTPALLADAMAGLATRDAVFGPAADGGFWLLGLRRPDPALLLGVPMSKPTTGAAQLSRLRAAGLSVGMLPLLRDVDTAGDAEAVAAQAPSSRFAAALAALAALGTGGGERPGRSASRPGHAPSSPLREAWPDRSPTT